LRVGIVGCGHVAEHHIRFIAQTKNGRVVGLADQDEVNARRLAEAHSVHDVYGSLEELLDRTPLDVLHILTPPAYHYDHAREALKRGIHVLVEKPCTLQACQTEELYRLAKGKGVLLCPDFIQLFHPIFQHAASVINSGRLGQVTFVEAHLSLDLNIPELREAKGLHWSYRLPGGVLHNYITHPLYLTIYWAGTPQRITVSAKSHGILPQGLTDHLAILLEGERCAASVVLSAAIQTEPYYVRVFCERGIVLVDFDTSTVLIREKSSLPRPIRRATSNFMQAWQLSAWAVKNVVNFARGKLVPYQGLQNLIPIFYSSIKDQTEPPVPPELAMSVTRVEEAIWAQAGKLNLDISPRQSKQVAVTRPERVLVTGAAGYVGSHVVRQLVKNGYYVRALVRELSHTEGLEKLGVQLMYGDVRDFNSLIKATEEMDILVHLAAALRGTQGFVLDSSVEGTKNVAEAACMGGAKRVIYMSSMSIYDYLKLRDGDVITEQSPLEEFPESRGTYSLAKRRSEDVALSHLQDESPSWTILRPSVIVGKGHDIFLPAGVKAGQFLICPSAAQKHLRLIHVEDVAAAVFELIKNEGTCGRVFTLSQPEPSTLREYVEGYIRANGHRNLRVVYVPYRLASLGMRGMTVLARLLRKDLNLNQRRLAYLYRDLYASSRALEDQTGWRPREGLLLRLKQEIN
jgi:2-alkyl-3-oxoalkanoate reductase